MEPSHSTANLIVLIEQLSNKGYGLGRFENGQWISVRGTWPGETVEITAPTSNPGNPFLIAQLLQVLRPHPQRQISYCPHFGVQTGQCSGCPWSFMHYDEQLRQKVAKLKHAINKRDRSGELVQAVRTPIAAPKLSGHRTRSQFKTDGQVIGFLTEGTQNLVSITDCPALNPYCRELFAKIYRTLPRKEWEPGEGYLWNFLEIDDRCQWEDLKLNQRRPFQQAMHEANVIMQSWVREKSRGWTGPVLELFAGQGNFTIVLAQNSQLQILAAEVAIPCVQRLRQKLESDSIDNVTVLQKDLFKAHSFFDMAFHWQEVCYALIDPPRDGLTRKKSFLKVFPQLKEILYISCDAETMADDLLFFHHRGWAAQEIIPLDQFPHTPRLEILVHLTKF